MRKGYLSPIRIAGIQTKSFAPGWKLALIMREVLIPLSAVVYFGVIFSIEGIDRENIINILFKKMINENVAYNTFISCSKEKE